MGDEDSNAIVSSKGCVEMWGGTNFGTGHGHGAMGEKWEAASGATAYNVHTMVAYFKLTLLPQCFVFFKVLGWSLLLP